MNQWVNLNAYFPKLRGQCLHVLKTIEYVTLNTHLKQLNFEIYTLDGAKIKNEANFFIETAKALNFPPHFGHNWDAWNDSLGDFLNQTGPRSAILWTNSDKTFQHDAQTLFEAIFGLQNLALSAQLVHDERPFKQIEIFLLGDGSGFEDKLS